MDFDTIFVGQDGPGGSGGGCSNAVVSMQSYHVMKIPTFNWDGEPSVATFLKHLELASRMGQWTAAQTLAIAKFKLTGRAEEYFLANPHLLQSYEAFTSGIKQHFTSQLSSFALEKMFSSCTQNKMESVSQFALRL
jgi:hypothetical protein